MPITYYFTLNMSGLVPLADFLGGVTLTPLQSIPETDIVEGVDTVLLGEHAYLYIRRRDQFDINSSLDRQARQMQYIRAFATQAFQRTKENPAMLLSLLETTAAYSLTNLSISEFSYLSPQIAQGDPSLEIVTLTSIIAMGEIYAEYYLDEDAVYETVLDVYYQQID
jgi:anionic cell wall polymer biosynthesis LytR-Cps2A-Psr (LCP) family protein